MLLFLQHLARLLLVDAQHRDEAVGLEDVGAMLAVGCDLLQQPVAFPQVGAGMGLCALGWGEAGGRQVRCLSRFVRLRLILALM